ncbi:MAG: cyclic nucleotide-binding domain-containing protein [Chlamydiae bacterium]|nr:cyclic nucleotide-binding domain-containing protein [Chlamydiota bacterium]
MEKSDSPSAFFDTCSLTSQWTLQEKEAFSKMVTLQLFKAKKVVFWEGDRESKMYFVKSGSVVVSKKVKGDVEEVLARFGVGDFFGELSLVDDSPRSATVQTEVQSVLLILEKEKLADIERELPHLASQFYRLLLKELVNRLRKTTEKLQEAVIWGLEATSLGEELDDE